METKQISNTLSNIHQKLLPLAEQQKSKKNCQMLEFLPLAFSSNKQKKLEEKEKEKETYISLPIGKSQ